jgi:hypothetical protein
MTHMRRILNGVNPCKTESRVCVCKQKQGWLMDNRGELAWRRAVVDPGRCDSTGVSQRQGGRAGVETVGSGKQDGAAITILP